MDEGDELGSTRQQLSPPPRRPSAPPLHGRDPLVGQQLGEYTVGERIGAGAMGTVYRGMQQTLGRPVAIKLVQSAFAGDPVFIDRFLAEARAAATVRHPNIIDVFSLGLTPGGQPYLVMELLEGDTLEDYLRYEGGRLEPRDAVELLMQTTAALAAAHRAGVIHRDLKPANIFVVRLDDENRFIKLLDFGISKRTAPGQSARATAAMVGTPMYMSPEAADGGNVGPFTDLYSLGCVAYELVTGHPPFGQQTVLEVVEAHHTAVPVPPTGPGVPQALTQLILELLEKDPARRPQSSVVLRKLHALAVELDAPQKTSPALHDRPTRPTRIRPAPPTDAGVPGFTAVELVPPTVLRQRPAARSRTGLWVAFAVAVLAAGGTAVYRLRPRAPAPEVEVATPQPPPVEEPKVERTPEPKPKVAAPPTKTVHRAPGDEEQIFKRDRKLEELEKRAAQSESAKVRAIGHQLEGLRRRLDSPEIDQEIANAEKRLKAAEAEESR